MSAIQVNIPTLTVTIKVSPLSGVEVDTNPKGMPSIQLIMLLLQVVEYERQKQLEAKSDKAIITPEKGYL